MNVRKPKRQPRRSANDFAVQYLADNVLTCYQLSSILDSQMLTRTMYRVMKTAMLANAAVFAKATDSNWIFLFGSLSEPDAKSVRDNLVSVAELTPCAIPIDGASGFEPIGRLIPETILKPATDMFASDPMVSEAVQRLERSR